MPSLLLIEFAVIERFHRGVEFPYLQGQAKARGIPVRWVRFGVHAAAEVSDRDTGVRLSAQDTIAAVEHMDDAGADTVIFSHRPSAALVADMNRGRTDCRYRYIDFTNAGDASCAAPGDVHLSLMRGDLDSLQGFPEGDDDIEHIEADTPDFSFTPGNRAAQEMEVLPFLFIGEECTWNRPFRSNPFFADLDLSACSREGGCAFCTRPPNRLRSPVDPVQRLERQLRAMRATCPTFGRRLSIRLVGEPVIRNIREVIARIIAAGLPPSDLLLDSRADTLARVEPELCRALEDLDGTGHCLHLCLIGIESFSSRELRRLNKGLGAADNLAAIRILFSLETEYPDCFAFRRHGGLSLITYTPWTTPEELDLNQAVLELLHLAPYAGKHLTGRLRLYPSLPLEVRARRDGLLRDRYDDPLLDTARLTFYEDEVPWVFEAPVMEPINRLLIRLEHDGDPGDPLGASVRALDEEARAVALPHTTLAHIVIQNALRLSWFDEHMDPEALAVAVRSAVGSKERDDAPPVSEEWVTRGATRQYVIEGQIIPQALLLDLKPVSKVEPLRQEAVARWTDDPTIPNALVRPRVEVAGEPRAYEIFYGRRRQDVERAVALTNSLEDELPAAEFTAAYREIGELLGYPSCCAESYATAASGIRASYFWLHVANRIGIDGDIPWEMSPSSLLVEHVPCGLDCEPTLVRARGILETGSWPSPSARAAFEASLKNPRMLFYEDQSAAVELIPQDEPGERFRYRVGLRSGDTEDVEALVRGDELEVGPETLLVLRRGRPWASLSGRAFLWWHRRSFQADLWRGMLDVRRVVPVLEGPPGAEPDDARDSPPSETMLLLDHLLQRLRKNAVDIGGLTVKTWEHQRDGRITLRLHGGETEIRLVAQEDRDGISALWREGPFALSYPSKSPLRGDAQWAAARSFRSILRRSLLRLGYPYDDE